MPLALNTTQAGSISLAKATPAITGASQRQQMKRYRNEFVGLDPGIFGNQVKWH